MTSRSILSAFSCFWALAKALVRKINADNISVLAAGVAFYALLSIFPALSALVSVYGLIADPAAVRTLMDELGGVLPPSALLLLSGWLETLLARPRSNLGTGLVISLAFSLWAARNASATMITALNVAYGEADARSMVRYNFVALALTMLLLSLGMIAITLVAVIPALLNFLPLPTAAEHALSLVRWPILGALVLFALAVTYRFGPNRRSPRWQWLSAGGTLATLLWIAASIGFSFYVGHFANYDRTYGSVGAVVVLLLWFWLGAYAVLAGAELNALLEEQQQGQAISENDPGVE